jgi:hypothetical protein
MADPKRSYYSVNTARKSAVPGVAHVPFEDRVLAVVDPIIEQAVEDYLIANSPAGGLTIDQIKADTEIDAAIDNTHASGSDNQVIPDQLSDLADDTTHRLVTDTEKNTWNAKSNLALGETETTAHRGDEGHAAYDHSQAAHAPSNAQKNSDITKGEIEAKLTGEISTHTHAGGAVPTAWGKYF